MRANAQNSPDKSAEDRLIMEIVRRVDHFDMAGASPKVKGAVDRYLAANRGSKDYFAFVERFNVATEKAALLQMGLDQAGSVNAANAFKTLIKWGEIAAIKDAILSAPPAKMAVLFDTLSLSQSREAAEVILHCIGEAKGTPEMKTAAVRSLGKSRNGENLLLETVRANKLPPELRLCAGEVLAKSADKAIRQSAGELIPMPKAAGDKPLPPLSQLAARTGNPAAGREAFGKYCMTCHKLGDQGIEFGPSLMEIGSKLAKEALYASILDPSAGISFGFEGWEVKTKKGDAYLGMIAGETDSELSLKVPGGIVVKTPKAEVAQRKKLDVSLMTPNLAGAMSEQELVDLVEFLTSLKKK